VIVRLGAQSASVVGVHILCRIGARFNALNATATNPMPKSTAGTTSPIDWDWSAELETYQIRIVNWKPELRLRKYHLFPIEEWMRNSPSAFSAK
jgi:hypothetical protein